MKVRLIATAFALSGAALFSLNSWAADTNESGTAAQPAKTVVTPHSHPQEKGFGPAGKAVSSDKAGKSTAKPDEVQGNPANDRSKHFHPRDR